MSEIELWLRSESRCFTGQIRDDCDPKAGRIKEVVENFPMVRDSGTDRGLQVRTEGSTGCSDERCQGHGIDPETKIKVVAVV